MNIESYDKLYDFRIIFSIWIIDDIFDWNFLILQLLIVSTFNSILRNEYFYIHYSGIVFIAPCIADSRLLFQRVISDIKCSRLIVRLHSSDFCWPGGHGLNATSSIVLVDDPI